jgi:hypothetical protein
MIVTGMLMRAGGFAAMAVAHEPWVLWLSCILPGSAARCSIRRGRRWWSSWCARISAAVSSLS